MCDARAQPLLCSFILFSGDVFVADVVAVRLKSLLQIAIKELKRYENKCIIKRGNV